MENNKEETKQSKETKFIDIHETTSNKRGIWGVMEVFLRRHKTFAYLFFISLLCLCV